MTTKMVRIYQPICVERDGTRVELKAGFWAETRDRLKLMAVKDRTCPIHLAPHYGDAQLGTVLAHDYIRIGRVRKPVDFPDTVDANGTVAPLELDGADIFEGAYVVPFGTGNQFAFMGPLRGTIVSASAAASWLTQTLGLVSLGKHIEFVPEVDPHLLRQLEQAEGLKRLKVQVAKDAIVQTPAHGRGQIESAITQAVEVASHELDVAISFSAGHGMPSLEKSLDMKETAKRLLRFGGAKSIEVSMLLENADGTETKVADLLKNKVGFRVEIPVDEDTRVTPDDILQAIDDAIEQYRSLG